MSNPHLAKRDELISIATKQQMSASNPRQSVWVEASAGTGKTKVLSDRVLRLLLSKVSPQKILCLTYTKAAAVEMNERIAKRLSLWAVIEEEELEKELKNLLGNDFIETKKDEILNFARTLFAQLLDAPGGMKIQTIHSFCQDILKRFPLEAGISPYFDVLDDRNAKEILQEIKLDLLKSTFFCDDSQLKDAVKHLTQTVSEFKFPEIMNMITQNRTKIGDLIEKYNGNLSKIFEKLEECLNVKRTETEDDIKIEALSNINKTELKNVISALLKGGKTDVKNAQCLCLIGEGEINSETYNEYRSIFLTAEKQIRSRLATKDAIKEYPEILDFMTNEAQKILDTENKLASLSILKSTSSVLYIAKNIIDKYNQYKKIYSTLDYEDLIIITKNLLENKDVTDWVLFKLDGGIEHILIDEAQDTSPNQWAIIRAITQEFFAGVGQYDNEINRSVFVVGDRKQSIYSFQGADPNEFDKMYNYFKQKSEQFLKVHLDVSFRSTKAIMDCVNILFENEVAKKGVVAQGEHINHLPFRLGDGGKVEIFPLVKINKEDKNEEYNWRIPVGRIKKQSVSDMLAKQIALNIKNMVENKDILESQNRPVRYGDFMFLVQQRKSFVEEFVRACKEIGVNVAGVDKLKLLEQIAVLDLISLGKFLLLPSDDLSLAEVLKSPIFGLNDDDLFELCYNRKGTLFERILKNEKYGSVAIKLKEWLNLVGYVRPFELYSQVLINGKARQNYISRMGCEVEDILDEFLNLTIIFEQKHNPTLESFINWIVKDEVVIQKEMEQGDSDTVKIMTVHGSKGLQAPIVILADTTKIKNKSNKSELLWQDDIVFFPQSASCYDNNCKAIKNKNLEADFDEYRRLLYVALTRAEDRLYIAGFTKDDDAKEESWYKLLQNNIKSNISQSDDDKKIVYQIPQENEFKKTAKIETIEKEKCDYSYLFEKAPIENPLAKPYTPSKGNEDEVEIVSSPLDENGNFYKRGTIIHKLLQFIPSIDEENRESAMYQFLEKNLYEYSKLEHEKIVIEIMNLCKEHCDLFSQNSKSEVPIIGEVDGKFISAKIDRLVVKEDKVLIVDFKTNRPAAKILTDVPDIYLKQMATYKTLLKNIYPDKNVETYLLWTNTCNMMKV